MKNVVNSERKEHEKKLENGEPKREKEREERRECLFQIQTTIKMYKI